MKTIVKMICLILVGMTVFTGALYIASGAREHARKTTSAQLEQAFIEESRAL